MHLSQLWTIGPDGRDENRGHHNTHDDEREGVSPLLNTEIGSLMEEEEHDGLDDRRKIFKEAGVLEDRALAQAYNQRSRPEDGVSEVSPL